ncbi:cryptochrome/photolyase family protein [Mariniblastus fucicola]|uniref:Deoxyribodipyrimidine photolyase n=1 Tax=Mariniblastus fucicola TaxID=980251 RepID=A0A5B9PC68_9BACT|nr:cryptochrome/photolyase family protein [Mariniblastus fucicola]QEG24327.1 deoxyribodipyrimidine photolyase [Mariniblastus fucicola]
MFLLIFPNQLFANHPGLKKDPRRIVLIEDSLFFGDANYSAAFHKQKLWLHRASLKRYEAMLVEKGFKTIYLEHDESADSLKTHLESLLQARTLKPKRFETLDPVDFMLSKRLNRFCDQLGIKVNYLDNPGFLNSPEQNAEYRSGKKRWFMADFYKSQRRRLNVLVDDQGEPFGGKWSFDEDNRKKVPKKMLAEIPAIPKVKFDAIDENARDHVEEKYADNPGNLESLFYPTSHRAATSWLKNFLKHRFDNFGPYEDAIVENESWLWHSVLTPMLNVGLLTPKQIVKATLKHAESNDVPLNSLEGFLRQIIGWREFIRATYDDLGVTMRNSNRWNHTRDIPKSFYDGTTGILPIDDTIKRILNTGYCHHIERLMVLGGFMFLCEFEPKQIYRWFMEMFVDSYDWVMVPNVYAMSQHADGGLITTKPYFSGSSYVRKMSHHKKAPWCDVWDGLYWRWIWNHADELAKNPRWAMMCSMARKMDSQKRDAHLKNAQAWLDQL